MQAVAVENGDILEFEICRNHKGIFLDASEEDLQMFL